MLKERNFNQEFLPYTQIIDKSLLIDCANSQLPLLLMEEFYAKAPAQRPLPLGVFSHVTPHKQAVYGQPTVERKRGSKPDQGNKQVAQNEDLFRLGKGQSYKGAQKKQWKVETSKLKLNQQNLFLQSE